MLGIVLKLNTQVRRLLLGHRNSTLGVEYMKCLTHLKECEIRAPVVQKIANWIASGDLYKWQDNMTIFRFNSVEVLHRE